MKPTSRIAAITVAVAALALGCVPGAAPGVADEPSGPRLPVVQVQSPLREKAKRTSTQPAAVHAYFEARLYAKVAGYVKELQVDIGQSVSTGEALAVIAVPELARQREAKLATVRRLEADEQRANAELAVAAANVQAFAAMVDQAIANISKWDANLEAARIELKRVSDLVDQRAVATRLLDESQKRFAAAEAEKTAADAAVASARPQLALAQAKGQAAQSDVLVAQAVTDVARHELEEMDELLKYATLVAPFDGIITSRHVDPGDLVRNAQTGSQTDDPPLLVVSQIDPLRVRVAVPERDAPLVDVGDAARVRLSAFGGREFPAAVARTSKSLDPQTRTMLVELELANPDGRLLPGMFGEATIDLESERERILLPANTVRYDEQGKSFVYVLDGSNQVQLVEVATGIDVADKVEIVSGLTGDERLVGPSLRRFAPGQSVSAP